MQAAAEQREERLSRLSGAALEDGESSDSDSSVRLTLCCRVQPSLRARTVVTRVVCACAVCCCGCGAGPG